MRKKKRWKCSAASAAFLAALCLVVPVWRSEAAGQKRSKVTPEAVIFGTVFQENGFLVRGARVEVSNADHPKQKKEAITDIQGEFAVRVPAGKARYMVEVSAKGFAPDQKMVEIAGDERIDLTFHLSPLGK